MDGGRVQDAHRGGAALLALGERLVGHPLDHVEDVTVVAFVLVDRHRGAAIIAADTVPAWQPTRREPDPWT